MAFYAAKAGRLESVDSVVASIATLHCRSGNLGQCRRVLDAAMTQLASRGCPCFLSRISIVVIVAKQRSHGVFRLILESLSLVPEFVAIAAIAHERTKATLVAASADRVRLRLVPFRVDVAMAALTLNAALRGFVTLVCLMGNLPTELRGW